MVFVDLNNAEKDMIVAEDLLSAEGKVILKKGTVLTVPIINRLKSRGIAGITVQGDEQHQIEQASPSLAVEMEKVERRFSDVRDDAIMEELLCAVREYLLQKGAGNGT